MNHGTPAQRKKWNRILAKHELSVWSGKKHHVVYMNLHTNTTDELVLYPTMQTMRDNNTAPQSSSDHEIFRLQVLAILSKRERTFLEHYCQKSVIDISIIYGITEDAVHSRIRRLRKKCRDMATRLERSLR